MVDIFTAAGLRKPDISILSDEFLAEVKQLPQKNLAVEMLRKLLTDEIKTRSRRNVVKSRLFSELLAESIRKYQNRAIQSAQVIEELIGLAKQMREESEKGEALGLTEDEVAFYDALEVNDSAAKVLGDETLKTIARELVDTVRRNTTIDWTVRENVRAHLRVLVKRILRKYGYPPDKQEKDGDSPGASRNAFRELGKLMADLAKPPDRCCIPFCVPQQPRIAVRECDAPFLSKSKAR